MADSSVVVFPLVVLVALAALRGPLIQLVAALGMEAAFDLRRVPIARAEGVLRENDCTSRRLHEERSRS